MKKFTYNVVKSMTMNEKRYFKIFCNRHVLGSQNKYLQLFDIINKHERIDIELINEYNPDFKYSNKNLSADINYLNKILLRSLNEYSIDKTCDLKIKQNLISIEILFFKGLYEECLTIIKKAKKINLKNENQALMIDLLNWEKKCLGYSKGLSSAMSINQKLDLYTDSIKQNRIITDLYYQSYFLKNSIGKIPSNKIIADFETVFKASIFLSEGRGLVSVRNRILYNLTYANYYNVIRDSKKELGYLEKSINLFNVNTIYKNENPLDYISIYNRVLDIIKHEKDIVFNERIKELRSFNTTISFQNSVIKERIYLHTHKAELEYLIYNDAIDVAFSLMQEVKKIIDSNKYTIEPYYFVALYYLFACVHCKLNDFSSGLKFINAILNKYTLVERPKIYIKAEILNIIIHYELNNYELVLTHINNIKKKYARGYKFNFIEKRLIKTLMKTSLNPLETNIKNEFKKLYKKLKVKTDYEKIASNHFYLNYVNSKIDVK